MGDRNTAFFHRCASYMKKKNLIKGLENGAGDWVTDYNKVSTIATDFFRNPFSTTE